MANQNDHKTSAKLAIAEKCWQFDKKSSNKHPLFTVTLSIIAKTS